MNALRLRRRWLRLCLAFAAVTWGVALVGVFATWPQVLAILQGLGLGPVPYDPMLDYWLRMAAAAYSLIGLLYLVLFFRPARHHAIIPWFGVLMVVEGLVLLAYGLRLGLPAFPFYADTAACLLTGTGILWFSRGRATPDKG